MKDATTQTDAQRDILSTLQVPPVDIDQAADGPAGVSAGVKLSRKERRYNFWGPIHEKIVRQQEKRHNNEMTTGAEGVGGTRSSAARSNAPPAGGAHSTNHQPYGRPPNNGGQARDRPNGQHGRGSTPSRQTPQRPRHDPQPSHLGSGRDSYRAYGPAAPQQQLAAAVPRDPSHAFFHNLRGSACSASPIGVESPYAAHMQRQRAETQSSATQVGDMGWSPTSALPMVVVTSLDAPVHSTRSVPDLTEIGHTVMGMAPPTPLIPSVPDRHIDAELESPIEPLELLMPDAGSSNCAPKTQNVDWDGKTHVAEVPERSRSSTVAMRGLPSSKNIVEMLFSEMKEPVQTPDRSWTFPGRECSLSPPVSLHDLRCVSAGR